MHHHRWLRHAVLSFVLLLHLCTAAAPRARQDTELQAGRPVDCNVPFSADLLDLSPGSEVFLESDSDFAQRSIRWTDYMRPGYSIVVKPATVLDVQKLVSGVHHPGVETHLVCPPGQLAHYSCRSDTPACAGSRSWGHLPSTGLTPPWRRSETGWPSTCPSSGVSMWMQDEAQ